MERGATFDQEATGLGKAVYLPVDGRASCASGALSVRWMEADGDTCCSDESVLRVIPADLGAEDLRIPPGSCRHVRDEQDDGLNVLEHGAAGVSFGLTFEPSPRVEAGGASLVRDDWYDWRGPGFRRLP